MKINFSYSMVSDTQHAVQSALDHYAIVNVASLAREIQARNYQDNVALEDIEALILKMAENAGAPMLLQNVKAGRNGWSYNMINWELSAAERL
jgi:hypothetical protein